MKFRTRADVVEAGFSGFLTVADLQASRCDEVPKEPGVYLILRESNETPVFLKQSIGGHFKGKDPTVCIERLESEWVDETVVLYIGKGDKLKRRLRQYMQFGQGKPKAHKGGRLIWQLADSNALLVCWKSTPKQKPRDVEKQLIQKFKAAYGRRPFANLKN